MSDWRKSAACAGYDPELWFPGNSQLMRREAIHICHTCPVIEQCRKIRGNKQSNLRIPITGHLGRQGIHTTRIPKEDSEVTTQSDEYRCEAYAILYSFHQSDNPIEAFAQGYEAGAKSREQVSEQQIETVSRILYKCSFGFPFDEDSIDGMFDHAVQSGHMPCRRKAEQLIKALMQARREPAC